MIDPDPPASLDDIRALETISFRGWSALESELYDGWLLRAANGYTGRANSINPLYGSSLPLDEKIAWCDAWYAARRIAPLYRLNDAMQPPDLDAQLAARGYRRFNESWVMVGEIGEALTLTPSPERRVRLGEGLPDESSGSPLLAAPIEPRLSSLTERRSGEGLGVRANSPPPAFSFSTTLTDDWIADLCRLNPRHAPHVATMRVLIERMPPQRLFGRVMLGDAVASVGLGVLHEDYLGLYDIVTDERLRGRGCGRALVGGLMATAHAAGIRRAYLQVAADNAPAIHLYGRLGFVIRYKYWYRGLQRVS